MTDFLAAQDRALLERHGLDSFDALWAKQLEAVDEPNTDGGAGAACIASTWKATATTSSARATT
ncbi:hypothetical protein TRE132_05300 [Pseudomonas chlororaphis subsp. aurantiaca]|nr:hypothetical protein TRE132_05300 [Pseudomonas chlororaphis subsp. aurantiaca]